jgi:hypothetical protein
MKLNDPCRGFSATSPGLLYVSRISIELRKMAHEIAGSRDDLNKRAIIGLAKI